MKLFIIALLISTATRNATAAASVQTLVITNVLPSTSMCTAPTSYTNFSTSDTNVIVYFVIQGANTGDQVTVRWINSSNVWKVTTTWNPLTSSGSYCFNTSLSISQWLAVGSWTAQVYINGQYGGSQATFTVAAASIEPRGPSYNGSFDPISTDCSHLGGWALDTNNPSSSITVDIAVSGYAVVHATANLARSDLTGTLANHAWNYFNLQPYEDGQNHTVHVYYGGTTQDLPGSPKTFPPSGFQQSTCVATAPTVNLTANWTSGGVPPQALASGQSYFVAWQVAGASQIQSRVCYGTSSNPSTLCTQQTTAEQTTGPSSLSAQITAPTVSGVAPVTYYFVVQAQAGGQTVYSPVVGSLDTGTTIGPSNTQTYTFSPGSYPNLHGLTVVVQKQYTGGTTYKYSFYAVADNSGANGFNYGMEEAHLTIVSPHNSGTTVHRTTLAAQYLGYGGNTPSSQLLSSLGSIPWSNPSKATAVENELVQWALGFIPWVGGILSTATTATEVATTLGLLGDSAAVGPSATFNGYLGNDNYDVYGVDMSGIALEMTATVLTVTVDQAASTDPDFFLLLREDALRVAGVAASGLVGVEIRGNFNVPIIETTVPSLP